MAQTIKIGKISDFPLNSLKQVKLNQINLAIANLDGKLFAIDDDCSHAKCSLGKAGLLEGSIVTCGCHGAQFDVTNGKVLALPATQDVRSYKLEVKNGEVYLVI